MTSSQASATNYPLDSPPSLSSLDTPIVPSTKLYPLRIHLQPVFQPVSAWLIALNAGSRLIYRSRRWAKNVLEERITGVERISRETMYPVIANSLCARMDRIGGRAGQQQQERRRRRREKEVNNNNGGIFEDVRCRASAREFTSEGCVSRRPKLHCSNLVSLGNVLPS